MELNLPILHLLEDADRVLIAGAGGGFDVFAGLPLYFSLRERGKVVHLANLTFTELSLLPMMGETVTVLESLVVGARGPVRHNVPYYPEGFLAQWFQAERGEDVTVYLLARRGIGPMVTMYRALIEHLGGVDAVILVDGGVDALMRGDEQGAGTLLEDTVSLAAVAELEVPVRLLANLGFGTEVEEAVCHYNALENMAALVAAGAFHGACALTPQMPVYQQYAAACRYVWDQPRHSTSHISTRILPAVEGQFGNVHLYPGYTVNILVSPLMSLYWFFDAGAVAQRSLLAPVIRDAVTYEETFRLAAKHRISGPLRPRRSLPY